MHKILLSLSLLILLSLSPILQAKTILIVGDSISAAYGIPPEQGWVNLLQRRLAQKYPKQHRLVNASVSGETTAGALARLPQLLRQHQPQLLLIELGGNDGLRGQPPHSITANLAKMVSLAQAQNTQVILFGMKIPPNYGRAYSQAFEQSYRSVAQRYQIKLLPFFLDGVAGRSELMQQDLIHPNAKAQPLLLNLAWRYIEPALK
jgi:acyl-CoA thioesterase-1